MVKALVNCTERTQPYKMCMLKSQLLFCKRAGIVRVNAILENRKYFFTTSKQTFWSFLAY